jgi:hypothetical protein
MNSRGKSARHRPPWSSKGRLRAFLLAILGTTSVLLGGWKALPRVERQVRIRLAERAIAEGRLDEARGRLALLISERPACTEPRLLLARVAREQGRITEAEEVLQRAIDLGLPIELARREHDLLASSNERHSDVGRR